MKKICVLLFSGFLCVSALADDDDRDDRRGYRHHDRAQHQSDQRNDRKRAKSEAKHEAREVCQDLRGGTQGLFRLCVAFCKVRELDKLGRVLDPKRVERRARRSERVLARYNERKLPGDPDMPCIETATVCPCWGSEVESTSNWTGRSTPATCLARDTDTMSFGLLQAGDAANSDRAMVIASMTQQTDSMVYECANTDNMTDTSLSMPISEVDYNVCRAQVTSTCGALGL